MLCHLVKCKRTLSSAAKIVDRMAELTALSLDVMKSTTDVANYSMNLRHSKPTLRPDN